MHLRAYPEREGRLVEAEEELPLQPVREFGSDERHGPAPAFAAAHKQSARVGAYPHLRSKHDQ